MTAPPDWQLAIADAAAAILEAASRRIPWLAGPPAAELVAVGVSTVDWQRAARALGDEDWPSLPRDPLLGATVHRAPSVGEPIVLLLEPDTEGPVAATLARFGEGAAAVYVRSPSPHGPVPQGGRAARSGPFGPARLLPGPASGPHVVALLPGATIER